jgi:hypothetical protein
MADLSLPPLARRITATALAAMLVHASVLPVALAQDKPAAAQAKPDKKTRDAARTAYTAGEKAYDKGDYAAALESFNKAYDLIPTPHAEYWIAKSLEQQGKVEEAVAAYQKFLDNPDAAKAGEDKLQDAKTRQAELKGKLQGDVNIVTTPPGAQVTVDGTPQMGETPMTLKLAPGKHTISVSLAGYDSKEVAVDVAAGQQTEQTIELVSAEPPPETAAPPPPVEPPPQPAPPPEKKSKIPAYVTLGIAGAGAIVGTIFGIKALGAQSDFDDEPTTEHADDVERNALIADMAFGVAITLGVTGVVLLTSADDDPAAETSLKRRANSARFRFAPYVSQQGGGAAARFSF